MTVLTANDDFLTYNASLAKHFEQTQKDQEDEQDENDDFTI